MPTETFRGEGGRERSRSKWEKKKEMPVIRAPKNQGKVIWRRGDREDDLAAEISQGVEALRRWERVWGAHSGKRSETG